MENKFYFLTKSYSKSVTDFNNLTDEDQFIKINT